MPRQKGSAPRRLDADDRISQQWNMQEQIGTREDRPSISLQDADSSDVEYVPSGSEDDIQAQTVTIGNENMQKGAKSIEKASKTLLTSKFKEKFCHVPVSDHLQSLIDSATFYVEIRVINEKENNGGIGEPSKSSKGKKQLSSSDILATLGQFQFALLENDLNNLKKEYNEFHLTASTSNELWLYISPIENLSFFYFEKTNSPNCIIAERKFYQITNIADNAKHLQAFKVRTLGLKKSGLCLTLDPTPLNAANKLDETIVVDVSIIESNLPKLDNPSDNLSKFSPMLKEAQEHFLNLMASENKRHEIELMDTVQRKFDIVYEESDLLTRVKPDVDQLYEIIKDTHDKRKNIELWNSKVDINPQHKSLLPKLRPYQVNAVRWMVFREMQVELEQSQNELHPLYREVRLPSFNASNGAQTLYYNEAGGYFTKAKPLNLLCPPGGILADEMGLGKTVEILSLLLTHRRSIDVTPAWKEPIQLAENSTRKVRNRRQRIRSQSPNEFKITTHPNDNEDESTAFAQKVANNEQQVNVISDQGYPNEKDRVMQVKGNQDDMNSDPPARKKKKKESLYDKLKADYDRKLEACSDAYVLSDTYKNVAKCWYGTFFDTKVAPKQYFECVCGAEDYGVQSDPKYRVQCRECHQWQHSECLGYDLTDPWRGEYYCPHCWASSRPPVESSATLIVSPAAIAHQWIQEMQRHLSANVRVLFYRGTKESGYIQPQYLATNYDIVVTTYNILQLETNHVDLPHNNSSDGRRFRHPKRWSTVSAVLPCVNWWRICLDEAQMIEGTMSNKAIMARRLSAVNRWCVTGTPIGKSLNDIYGLLLFLEMDPWKVEEWWKVCLYLPYLKFLENAGNRGDAANSKESKLAKVLSDVLWRTSKKQVLNQINIPGQTEEVHLLKFGPVEEAYYRRQHNECTNEALQKFKRISIDPSTKLSQLDSKTMASIIAPVLKLRQICCHPQMVRGLCVNLGQQKTTLTMEELLDKLIKNVKGECEDSNRQKISALNGLAGLDIIEEKWKDAVDKYREVLRFAEEHKSRIKTDSLQRLHAITNLVEVLETKKDLSIAPTLRDSELRSNATEIRDKYMAKHKTSVNAASTHLAKISQQVLEIRNEFEVQGGEIEMDCCSWYEEVINSVCNGSETKEDPLIHSILDEMSEFYDAVNDREMAQIRAKYSSLSEVLRKISLKVIELDESRDSVSKELSKHVDSQPEDFVNGAVDCHLRVSNLAISKKKQNHFKCKLCEVHDLIELYESQLFHFVKGEVKSFAGKVRETLTIEDKENLEKAGVLFHEEQRKGTWADSEAERLIKSVLKYAKQQGRRSFPPWIVKDGNSHVKLLDAMKREFRLMRILWSTLYDQVAAVDEINMSTLRLRLRLEDEPYPTKAVLASMKPKHKAVGNDEKAEEDGSRNLAIRVNDKYETIYILEPHEMSSQRLKLVSEKTIAEHEFRKNHGQLLYLENLKTSKAGVGGNEYPEPCPVCQNPLGAEWNMLQCGHSYCIECLRRLIQEFTVRGTGHRSRSVRCAICRNLTLHSEVSYVKTKIDSKDESSEDEVYKPVKGSLSTKIEAVVKTLVKIQTQDPSAKSLVFSTWNGVLDILGEALDHNDIKYAALQSKQVKFHRNLQKFKNREDVKVLLLPLKSGANGLNLIEASHVLLVEPILNPAEELQAIGRVHRIGQTKATVVHRFVVQRSMEERIHSMLKSHRQEECERASHCTEENTLTFQDLKSLFVKQNKKDIGEGIEFQFRPMLQDEI